MRNALVALLALGAVALSPRPARGDDAAASAEALFDDARRLMAQHRYAEACNELAASESLDPGIGTLLNLGDCQEKLGRVASAWATFREAASLAAAAGQRDRERVARDRAAALQPRLARLTVLAPSAEPGLEILRDGAPIARPLWGLAIPVDPGAHVIEARAPGKLAHRAIVEVPDDKPARVTVTIPELGDAPASIAAGPRSTGRATRRTLGFVALGVGGASLAAGSLFAVRAFAENTASESHCRTQRLCDAEGVSLRNGAFTAADWSTAAFVTGALLIGGGATLILTAPRDEAAPRPSVALRVAGPSLSLEGAW